MGGSLQKPEIVANQVIELLPERERFCYHRAATMTSDAAREWLAGVRAMALARARIELSPLLRQGAAISVLVAREGDVSDFATAVSTHLRIHSAEGFFYRDIFRDACQLPCRVVAPSSLDITRIPKLATKPWARDQKLAAAAAWRALHASDSKGRIGEGRVDSDGNPC